VAIDQRQHQSQRRAWTKWVLPTAISGTWGSDIRDGLFLEQSLIEPTALNIRREF
jgi:hypothetical protein